MKTVIFACVQNAGRSQMAAAFFNQMSHPQIVRAISAGTDPAARIHPEVVEVMREVGIELAELRPQPLTMSLASSAQMLITTGCGDARPFLPWVMQTDWPVEDPAGQPLERIREIRDVLRERVWKLVAQEGWYRLRPMPPNRSDRRDDEQPNARR